MAGILKVVGSIPTLVRHIFQRVPRVDMNSELHHKHHLHGLSA